MTVPGGHNANGFDLRDLMSEVKQGLWSVKNQTKRGDFRLSNGLGGAGKGFIDPVVFLSPALPGLVFADPEIHTELAGLVKLTGDATVLPFRFLLKHAKDHPECVAVCSMPTNPGSGSDDPWLDYVESLLSPERFRRLDAMFMAARPFQGSFSAQIVELAALRDAGTITNEQFAALVDKLK